MTESKAVGIKQLKAHLSAFIKEVSVTGLRLLVNDRGKVVAQITTAEVVPTKGALGHQGVVTWQLLFKLLVETGFH